MLVAIQMQYFNFVFNSISHSLPTFPLYLPYSLSTHYFQPLLSSLLTPLVTPYYIFAFSFAPPFSFLPYSILSPALFFFPYLCPLCEHTWTNTLNTQHPRFLRPCAYWTLSWVSSIRGWFQVPMWLYNYNNNIIFYNIFLKIKMMRWKNSEWNEFVELK